MFLFVHRFGRLPKYQGKIAKMQYRDAVHARRAQRAAANRARWAAMTPRQRKVAVLVIVGIVVLLVIISAASGHGAHTG